MDYFVTNIQEIKENSVIELNVDDNKIVNLIRLSYDKYLSNICGIDTYLEYYNSNHSWTDDEKAVLDLIKQTIYNAIAYETLLNTTYNLTNKGVNTRSGDNSNNTDYQAFGSLRKNLLSNVDFYISKIHNQMKEMGDCKCQPNKKRKNIFFV